MKLARAAGRLLAAAVALALCLDGALALHNEPGLSQFGRPAWLAWAWAASGLATAWVVLRGASRWEAARCLSLLLLASSLFGQAALPAAPGLSLALTGATLCLAAPWIRPQPALLASAAALLLGLPGCLLGGHSMGAALWFTAVLPVASLTALLPALFPGRAARLPALVLTAATSLLCLAALSDYMLLARQLDLPLQLALRTRLRPMTLHPNLAVPSVVLALLVGAGLCWRSFQRPLAWLALLLPLLAALATMASKTGSLAAVAGLACLIALRARWPLARAVPWLLRAAVVAALLLPASGLSDASITHRSDSMLTKAVSFRSSMWQLGRDTLAAAPWHGFGPGSSYVQAAHARPGRYDGLPKDDHPHNVVLAVGEALGWPGLLGLALLLGVSLRRPTCHALLTDATLVAIAVHWAADGVDMGGAVSSLLPSGVLLLLGLSQARLATQPAGKPSGTGTTWGRLVPVLGTVLLLGGLLVATEQRLLSTAAERLSRPRQDQPTPSAQPTPPTPPTKEPEAARPAQATQEVARAAQPTQAARAASVEDALDLAGTLLPFDATPWVLKARAAEQRGDRRAQRRALEQAVERAPDRATLLHTLALLRSRDQLDDPSIPRLLQQAIELDPHGPDAWRRHIDRALLAAHTGDRETAFSHLVQAVLLNPQAVKRASYDRPRRVLRLSADGRAGLEIPLDELFDELARRRRQVAGQDSAYDARLRMREVDVLLALGELDQADRRCRLLLANEPTYLDSSLAHSAGMRGDLEGVIRHTERAVQQGFEQLSTRLDALSRSGDTSGPDFAREYQVVLENLADVVFETASVRRVLEARETFATRSGDLATAARAAAGLAYLSR